MDEWMDEWIKVLIDGWITFSSFYPGAVIHEKE